MTADFEVLNLKNKLTKNKLDKFCQTVKSILLVQVEQDSNVIYEKAYDPSSIDLFFGVNIDIHADDVIRLVDETSMLLFTGADFLKLKKQNKGNYVVRIGQEEHNVIKEIKMFEGSKRQCLEFLNKTYATLLIRSFFKTKYFVKVNDSAWLDKTMLKERGFIK